MPAIADKTELAREMLILGQRLTNLAQELLGEHEVAYVEAELQLEAEEQEEPEPRPEQDVGRFGVVNETVARVRAAMLGEFDRQEFANALGIKPTQTQKWLTKLLEADLIEFSDGAYVSLVAPELRDWVVARDGSFRAEEAAEAVKKTLEETQEELDRFLSRGIITSVNGNGLYRYEPPPNTSPRSRPRHMPPERERPSYELALATGEPVRVAATKKATRRQRSTAGAGGIKGAKAKDRRYNAAQEKKAERAEANKAKAQRHPGFRSRSGKRSRPVT